MNGLALRSLVAIFLLTLAGCCACSIAPPVSAFPPGVLDTPRDIAGLIAGLADPQQSSAVIQTLVKIGGPAASQLVTALESHNELRRENTASALRQILAANPGAAPNRVAMAAWLGRIRKVDEMFLMQGARLTLPSGSAPIPRFALWPAHDDPLLADVLAILLPDQEADQILQGNRCVYRVFPPSPFDTPRDGRPRGEVICQLDDYTSATFQVRGAFVLEVVQRPEVKLLSPRAVIVEPPAAFTGVWKNFYVNGENFTEEHYLDGKLEGRRRMWWPDGTLQNDDRWHHGWRIRDGR